MGEPAVKKDSHSKKVIAGRVTIETHREIFRRAAIDRRAVSQWLEIVLETYLREHPVSGPVLVPDNSEEGEES